MKDRDIIDADYEVVGEEPAKPWWRRLEFSFNWPNFLFVAAIIVARYLSELQAHQPPH